MKRKILIVDDEPGFTGMLKLTLESSGDFEVMEENSADRAVKTAREFEPDVMLIDVMMPEMDGGELASGLRSDPALAHVPVIFLTALIAPADAPKGVVASGGQMYLPKPVDLDKLLECIIEKSPDPTPSLPI